MTDASTTSPVTPNINAFIVRWQASGAAERANFQQFAVELCDIIGVPRPDPTTPHDDQNAYVFEKSVPLPHGTTGRIDLYKRGCLVMEAKQGSNQTAQSTTFSQEALQRQQRRRRGTAVRGTASWDTAMEKARQQAQSYARNLPLDEIQDGRPPFLLIVDVGNTVTLYSEFSRTGGNYIPFPDPQSYRLQLTDLLDANVRQLLQQIWLDPMSLDPARRSARVTRDIAGRLATLARSLERQHSPEDVAHFLMRCLFTMFAEDVGLLPDHSFTQLLADIRHDIASFQPMMQHLWKTMNAGGFSVILRTQLPRFNGGLFAEQTALPLNDDQVQLLVEAAQADWRDVEPAIFGTLLVRALDPIERHKLGAHYTPRAFVERLVQPTIIEPLRAEWDGVKAAALLHAESGQRDKAIAVVDAFQRRLATLRILDPACGAANFLYVTLEHLKRIEGEVLELRRELGATQMLLDIESVTVTPNQFLGIEINPRAAAIAELVLWIGYLQWQLRTLDKLNLPEPIIKDYHNIECRDAVLAWDAVEPLLDEDGQPVTHWDGRTTKPHPVTGQPVPDETARIPAYRYLNPRPATWPQADFVVGNPPFVGKRRIRLALGDGYVLALRQAYEDKVPDSCDYVMYWWYFAAKLLKLKKFQRFGLITTNSIIQPFNNRLVEELLTDKQPLSLVYAISDHPWVDSSDGAAVRIAMTVVARGSQRGVLDRVLEVNGLEDISYSREDGLIQPDLTVGPDILRTTTLHANERIASVGIQLNGTGFVIDKETALEFKSDPVNVKRIRPLKNGRDLSQIDRENFLIDVDDLELNILVEQYSRLYQWVYNHVKPERDQNSDVKFREYWWRFGRSRPEFRDALVNLNRYFVSPITSKHRFFIIVDSQTLVDSTSVGFALDDAFYLGVISSKIHGIWALRAGTRLGVGNDPRYNKTRCFDKFPFPDVPENQKARIRDLALQLDNHRKRQQAEHPKLTITGMYNVLVKLRAGQSFSPKEQTIHEQGLVSVLKQLHDDLDAAVFDAYGWLTTLSDEQILENLVALNAKRAAEEAQGKIRWLRPEYQAPGELQPTQATLIDTSAEVDHKSPTPKTKRPWPPTMAEQAQAIRDTLATYETPITAADIAARYGRRSNARITRITELLETLVTLGQARDMGNGRYIIA